METSDSLDQAIKRTVAWFSLFEMPVTVFEIWKWMLKPDRKYTLEEVYEAIGKNPTSGDCRQSRFLDATRKYKKLHRAVQYLKFVPGIEAIAAGNTLAWWNTRKDSDIDLFIIVRPGTIWLARLLSVAPFALLGRRPGSSAIDPFCFSFFVTTDALDLSSLQIEDGNDPYLAYWTASLVPVFDRGAVWQKFQDANRWTENYLPHIPFPPSIPFLHSTPPDFLQKALNRLARWFQLRRIPTRIKQMMNKDSRVIVTDHILKFHDNDRRLEYRKLLYDALKSR